MAHSEDDMPLDSLVENQLTPEKEKATISSSLELKKLTISESQFLIRKAQITLANVDEDVVAFIKNNIAYDKGKYELELFKSGIGNI